MGFSLRPTALLALSTLASTVYAASSTPTYPGEEPAGVYAPRIWPAALATGIYGATAIVQWYRLIAKNRVKGAKWLLTLSIGSSTMCLGYIFRIAFAEEPYDNLTIYVLSTLFVLLSPCAFLAVNYMFLARYAVTYPPDVFKKGLFGIRTTWLAKIFVSSDISTFLLQAAGGGISASKDLDTRAIGEDIALAALSLQAASFATFTVLVVRFGVTAWQLPQGDNKRYGVRQFGGSRTTVIITLLTCAAFLTRSVFRIIEYAGGYDGYVQTHEIFFYLLDALPVWIGILIWTFLWPQDILDASAGPLSGSDGSKPSSLQDFSQGHIDQEAHEMHQAQ